VSSAITESRHATLAEVDQGAWDSMAAGRSPFCSYRFLRYVEERTAMTVSYLIWSGCDGRIVAGLPTYRGDAGQTPSSFHPGAILGVLADEPVLLGGAAYGYLNDGPLIHPAVEPGARAGLLRSMVSAFGQLAAETDVRLSGFPALHDTSVRELAAVGYGRPAVALVTAVAQLPVPPGVTSFDDYVAGRPKGLREEVRRSRRRFASNGLTAAAERLPDHVPAVAALIDDYYRRRFGHSIPDPLDTQRMLTSLLRWYGEQTVLLASRLDGRLAGVIVGFRDGDTLVLPWLGLDDDVPENADHYFNLAYYAPLQHAISERVRSLDLGMGALTAKLRRGAILRPVWLLVEAADAATDWTAVIRRHNDRTLARVDESFGAPVRDALLSDWIAAAPRQEE
jgi:hypothetical protein